MNENMKTLEAAKQKSVKKNIDLKQKAENS